MKKFFFTLLTLCLCGATYAQTITDSNGCTYSTVTGTYDAENPVELTSGTSASGAVTIPATITNNGTTYTVVGIGQSAFAGESATSPNSSITSVTIPYTVTYIGNPNAYSSGAFYYCTNLLSVTFDDAEENPSQLTTISINAFYGCSALTSIDLPASVTTLGANVFMGCSSLVEAKLPVSVTAITGSCFRNCSALTTVWMSGSATLASYAFGDCLSLSAFVLEGSEPATTGGHEYGSDGQAGSSFYEDADETIILYVPTGAAPAYLATEWANHIGTDNDEDLEWNFLTYTNGISENAGDGNGTYYATYYTDAVGEFGDDVTPCIVTGEEEGVVEYSSISGYIPANTGLLLVASNPGTTYYYHPYGVTEATANVEGNQLLGSITATTTTGPNGEATGYYFYKLSRDSNATDYSVGFYWGATDGAAFESAAYKAWLALPSDSGSGAGISFKKDNDDTTGISSIENASEKAVSGIYTIQGVRVSNMNQPGLYIVDGRKVLVK